MVTDIEQINYDELISYLSSEIGTDWVDLSRFHIGVLNFLRNNTDFGNFKNARIIVVFITNAGFLLELSTDKGWIGKLNLDSINPNIIK